MAYEKGLRIDGAARSSNDEYINTLRNKMPRLDKLFVLLAAGTTPNFLDIMGAISDMVVFHTDPDQFEDACDIIQKEMSEKNCRFCS